MGVFYHFTPKRNLPPILREGLKPASITGNQNEYLFGLRGDPHYIYLWSEEAVKNIGVFTALGLNPQITTQNTALLKVIIDEGLVERDYDQLLFIYYDVKDDKEALVERVTRRAEMWGAGVEDFSPEGICKAIDAIPEDSYREMPGSYRTAGIIADPTVISWSEVVPRRFRFFGFFMRPLFRFIYNFKGLLRRGGG